MSKPEISYPKPLVMRGREKVVSISWMEIDGRQVLATLLSSGRIIVDR